jgi:hypothetical protein
LTVWVSVSIRLSAGVTVHTPIFNSVAWLMDRHLLAEFREP